MKFAVIALIATTVSAATAVTCTTADVATKCTAKTPTSSTRAACCGYLLKTKDTKAADATRTCGDGATLAADEKQFSDVITGEVWSCTEPKAAADGASKLALGLSALAAAFYMA